MTIFCSSLRRSDTGWIQVFILSLTQSDKSSSRGRISVKFIISRQLPLVFRRRVLSSNLLYGKISPDSSEDILSITRKRNLYGYQKPLFRVSRTFEGRCNTVGKFSLCRDTENEIPSRERIGQRQLFHHTLSLRFCKPFKIHTQ